MKKQLEDYEKVREEIISFKIQLKEAIRMEEVMNVHMMKKEEYYEKLEQEVVSLKKNLKNFQVPTDITCLGCKDETSYKGNANSNKKVEEKEISTQRVDEKWIRLMERRNAYRRGEYPRRPPTFRNQRSFN
jgi:hypothetical protein